MEVPAFLSEVFIISNASPVCWRTSPGFGRLSGYQPPIPIRNRKCPGRMAPPTDCLPALVFPEFCACAAAAPANRIAADCSTLRRPVSLSSMIAFQYIALVMKQVGQLRAGGAGDRFLSPALHGPAGRPRKTIRLRTDKLACPTSAVFRCTQLTHLFQDKRIPSASRAERMYTGCMDLSIGATT